MITAERLAELTPHVQRRIRVEERIVKEIVISLLNAGYYLGVDDGGDELAQERTRDVGLIFDALMNTDNDWLLVWKPDSENKRAGDWVFFVYGNDDGFEVVNDYSVGLEPVMKVVFDKIEAWQTGQELPV